MTFLRPNHTVKLSFIVFALFAIGLSSFAVPSASSSGNSASIIALSPVTGATPGSTVKLWAQVRNISYAALPQDSIVAFWVDGPNWTGSHWIGSTSTAGLAAGTEQWYSRDWFIPVSASGGNYTYWAQVFVGSSSISDWSNGQVFGVTGSGAPGRATLVSPIGAVSTFTPTYTWAAVSTATYYYLWVNDAASSPKIQQWFTAEQAGCASGLGNCAVTPSKALPNGQAQFWIQTYNQAGYGPWSEALSFIVIGGVSAYFPFSGNANDLSGNSNHGVVYGATLTSDRFGNPNSAYEFDGKSYITLTNNAIGNLNGNATIAFWLYGETNENGRVLEKDSGAYWWFIAHPGGLDMRVSYYNYDGYQSSILTASQMVHSWNFIAVVKNIGTFDFYVNGTFKSSMITPGNQISNNITLTWGRSQYWKAAYFKGKIDDTRLYNRALSSTEVQALYREGGWPIGTPGKATLISPSGTTEALNPTYVWNAVPAATWYQLWVNDSSTNAGKIKMWYTAAQAGCSSGTGTCSVTPQISLSEGSAQWWIQTWNDSGYGPWSDGKVFSVASTRRVLFRDDFESYSVGSFPGTGGWQLVYNGAGNSYQYVDNSHSTSGAKSLHLVGSSCWSGVAYHPVDIPSRVSMETNVYIDQITSCGCGEDFAVVGLYNPGLGTWGTAFGVVIFSCDGHIKVGASTTRSYNARTWYAVKLDVNMGTRTFDVYIDGVLYAAAVSLPASGMPSGVYVYAGHGGNPTAWFDDINVWAPSGTQSADGEAPVASEK